MKTQTGIENTLKGKFIQKTKYLLILIMFCGV